MGAYHNALREEGSRDDLMRALEKAWAENDRVGKAAMLLINEAVPILENESAYVTKVNLHNLLSALLGTKE